MTRTGPAAVEWAHGRVGDGPYPPDGMEDDGLCLKFTRQCFDVPSYYASAIDAWNANPDQRTDRNPPPAVPVWFWSSSPYRHVAFWDGSAVVSTYNDDVRVYGSIGAAESVFGGFLGWSPQVNRVTVWSGEDDDMPTIDEIAFVVARETANVMRGDEFRLSWPTVDQRIAANAAAAVPPAVWDASIGDAGGTDHARNWLVVARRAPEVNTKLDQLLAGPMLASTRAVVALAILILLAVIGGVALAIAVDAGVGIAAGVGALIGGVISVLIGGTRPRGRHVDTE